MFWISLDEMCVLHLLFPYETWLYLDTRDTSGMDYDSNVHIFGFFDRVGNAIKKKMGGHKTIRGADVFNFIKILILLYHHASFS